MDFRDKKVIKTLNFLIHRNKDNLPLVFYYGKDYSRMSDEIVAAIEQPVIILPLAITDYFPLIVVANNYTEGWTTLCATLQKNMFNIVNNIVRDKNRKLNVDALTRSLNKFKAKLEQSENLTLPDFQFVTEK